MPSSMTAIFETKYDGAGANEAVKGFRQVDDSLNKVEGSSDRLVTKLERPIGRIAYGGLAEGALNAASANAKLDGVAGTLHQTFHVLGSSLLFVNPELGFLALGASAIVTVFAKLSNSVAETSENIAHNVEIQRKLKNEYKESAETLKAAGLINNEQKKILEDSAGATEKQINEIKESVKKEVEIYHSRYEEEKRLSENRRKLGIDDSKLLAEAYKKYTDAVRTSVGLLSEARHSEDETIKLFERSQKAMGEKYAAQAKLLDQEKEKQEYAGIDEKTLKHMFDTEREIDDLTNQLEVAKTDVVRREVQARINEKMKELTADRTVLGSEKTILDKRAASFKEYDQLIADQWLESNHNMVKVAEMFGAQMIKEVANLYATQLEIRAAADFTDPLRGPGIAIAELAAATAIRTIGGGLASDLSGNQVSSNAPGDAGLSPSAPSSSAGSSAPAPRSLSLALYVQGHILGGEAALGNKLCEIISDRVVAGGAKLVSSSVVVSGGTAPR